MPRRAGRFRGVTLLEVLVALAIVGVLAGLLLPTIQIARAAAVRLKSANKLRQIVHATHNYAAAHGVLPGYDTYLTNDLTNSEGPNPFEAILPFLEGDRAITPNPYHERQWEYVPAYVSPADTSFARPLNGPGSDPGSFLYISGDHSYPANGQAIRLGATLTGSFPDGASTTVGFAERYARCHETATWWLLSSDGSRASSGPNAPLGICTLPSVRRPTFADPDYDDVVPVTVNGVTRPSVAGRTFQAAPTIEACDYRVPQTPHASGMLMAYLDGSVRMTRPGIDPAVFWATVTPAGGESVGDW